MRGVLISLIGFAVGLGAGYSADALFRGRAGSPCGDEDADNPRSCAVEVTASDEGSESPSDAVEGNASAEPSASTVEVVVDHTPAPDSEITAAHRARQARRAAAREAKEADRRDFLSTLNLDLLTESQRKTHELYVEALRVRDSTAAEIRRLRAAGEDVPDELQAQLTDAQSVLRLDHDAEYRALREAAARAAGLNENAVRQLLDDLDSIEVIAK